MMAGTNKGAMDFVASVRENIVTPSSTDSRLPNPTKNQRVAKVFDDGKLYFGSIINHFSPDETMAGIDLWKVRYDDGDKEDLNRWELDEALTLYQQKASLDDKKPPARRVTMSPTFTTVNMEEDSDKESENQAAAPRKRHWCESSDDEEKEELESLPTRKKHAAIQESSDEEEEEDGRLGKIKSLRTRNKYARLEQEAWLGGGDDEFSADEDTGDEELEVEEDVHRSELQSPRRSRRGQDFGVPPPPPVDLTVTQQSDMLADIEKPADKALQKLLLNEGFQFQLLPHQFLAVRRVAGVPDKFPLHVSSQVTQPEAATMSDAIIGLNVDVNKCTTKGVLIADDMGLGKTVEAIAGAMLRNALAAARMEKPRPTVIISPNSAVQVQWRDTLIKNGVLLETIHMFQVGQQSPDFDKPIFILMTRHTLQYEVKRVFTILEEATENPERGYLATSILFPHADSENLERLKVQYKDEASKYPIENKWRYEGELLSDCITRLVYLCTLRMQRKPAAELVFETLIIDEAHFLKNTATYWGIGAALIATHSRRNAPLTGTPYNNGPSDLAAMMTFIDAAKHSARRGWWEDATGELLATTIRNRVALWHAEYLVRRRKEDVLKELVKKNVANRLVSQFSAEQVVYKSYEGKVKPVLEKIGELLPYEDNPVVRKALQELHRILMALMSNMRSANVHAMLPNGREYTKQFSPTRHHLRSMEERPKSCVCCDQSMRPSIPFPESNDDDKVDGKESNGSNRRKQHRHIREGTTDVDQMEEFKETNDGAVEMHDEEEEELVPLPSCLCEARNGPVRHFAHQKCIDALKASPNSCPRCQHAKNTTQYELPGDGNRTYCSHIDGGFIGSSKLNSVVNWYLNEVPKSDKVLILSFFKGGLDLLEGIFCHDHGIDCARFDGDLDRRRSIAELERFKAEPDCKILLATVQSGGVGLNICEANHVAFLDRWYNPFVHQQAEDRCHRIGQTKDVNIVYFDCAATVDEAMLRMNKRKIENSAILLADGFEIGNEQTLSYQELSGVLGNLLAAISSHRTGWLKLSPENKLLPIPAVPEDVMADAMAGRLAQNQSAAAAQRASASEGGGDKPKAANKHAGTNGTEDFIVIDDDEEENEFYDDEEEAYGDDDEENEF